MGIAYNTSIVSDGLVFALDAANSRSYSGSGNTAFNLVGGIGNTLVNGVGFTSSYAGSFVFDGSNDYIPLGSLGTFYTEGTIGFWMNPSDVSAAIRNPFSTNYGTTTNANLIRFEIGELPNTFKAFSGNPSNQRTVFNFSNINSNTWYYVVAVWNQNTNNFKGYLNGSLNLNSSSPYWPDSFVNVGVGIGLSGRYFQGNMPSVQIYNRALTQQEIKQNYNATKKRYGL